MVDFVVRARCLEEECGFGCVCFGYACVFEVDDGGFVSINGFGDWPEVGEKASSSGVPLQDRYGCVCGRAECLLGERVCAGGVRVGGFGFGLRAFGVWALGLVLEGVFGSFSVLVAFEFLWSVGWVGVGCWVPWAWSDLVVVGFGGVLVIWVCVWVRNVWVWLVGWV